MKRSNFTNMLLTSLAFVSSASAMPTLLGRDVTSPVCDSYCKSRLFYQTAFSAANLGMSESMGAYQTVGWCNDVAQTDWCPQVVEHTLSAIAGNAATSIDKTGTADCSDECMVSSLSSVANKAALKAMIWVETNVDGTGLFANGVTSESVNQTTIDNLHWLMNRLSNSSAVTVDSTKLAAVMATPVDAVNPATTSLSQQSDQKHDDKDFAGLAALAVPVGVAPLMFKAMCTDPVLCSAGTSQYLKSLFNGAKQALPPSEILQQVIDRALTPQADTPPPADTPPETPEPVEPESEFQQWVRQQKQQLPDEFDDTVPPKRWNGGPQAEQPAREDPTGPSEALKPGKRFRVERFNPETQTLEQQTLRYIGPKVDQGPKYHGVDPARFVENGYRGFHMLDAEGKTVWFKDVKGVERRRVVWQRPSDLRPLDGEWQKVGRQKVQVQDGNPVVSSQGEPIIEVPGPSAGATPALGTLQVAALSGVPPGEEVKVAGGYAFRLLDADSVTVKGDDGSDALMLADANEGTKLKQADLHESTEAKVADKPTDNHEPQPDRETPSAASPTHEVPQATPEAHTEHEAHSATSQPTTTQAEPSSTKKPAHKTAKASRPKKSKHPSTSTKHSSTFATSTKSKKHGGSKSTPPPTITESGCRAPTLVPLTKKPKHYKGKKNGWKTSLTTSWVPCGTESACSAPTLVPLTKKPHGYKGKKNGWKSEFTTSWVPCTAMPTPAGAGSACSAPTVLAVTKMPHGFLGRKGAWKHSSTTSWVPCSSGSGCSSPTAVQVTAKPKDYVGKKNGWKGTYTTSWVPCQ